VTLNDIGVFVAIYIFHKILLVCSNYLLVVVEDASFVALVDTVADTFVALVDTVADTFGSFGMGTDTSGSFGGGTDTSTKF